MKSVNKVILLGAVGQDPEVRYTFAGMAVAKFSLATNSKKKNQNGEYEDKVQWHNCVAFGKLGKIIERYLVKGSKIYAEGEINYSQYTKEGVTVKASQIVLNELSMLSNKSESQTDSNRQSSQVENDSISDDDIPF